MPDNSLSVVFCSYNEEKWMGRQLEAAQYQLDPATDELVVLNDGSTDDTQRFIDELWFPNVVKLRHAKNRGNVVSYEKALCSATKEWVFVSSINDHIQPGAFDCFRFAAREYPSAAVIAGKQDPPMPILWADIQPNETVYLPPWEVQQRWTDVVQITGAGTFTRRLLHPGYDPDLKWHADFYALMWMVLRYGLVYVNRTITKMGLPGYDAAASDPIQNRPVIDSINRKLAADPLMAAAFVNPRVKKWLKGEPHWQEPYRAE